MMFSDGAFSEFAFGEEPPYTAPIASTAFIAFLADVDAVHCWLLEIDAFSLAVVNGISAAFGDAGFGELGFGEDVGAFVGPAVTLRYSSHGYISHATDSPANTWYEGRLTDQIRVERRISGHDGIGGVSHVFAEAEVINADAALDDLQRNYAIDGRAARLYLGRPSAARADYGLVFGGVVQTITSALGSLKFALSDGAAKLEVPVQKTLYAGTGGNEGGADLAGKPKPLCLGQVFNISPPLVDSGNLIYQVHDGAINDVTAAYDRGIALAKVGGAPGAGQYQVNTTLGTFKLGAAPAGTVTADVKGDASLSGYVDQTNFILLRLLTTRAGLTDSEIEPASFGALNSDAPASVGIWIGTETRNVVDVVDELLTNIGAFGGFSRVGTFRVAVLKAPASPVLASYGEKDIFDLERLPLPSSVEPVVWRAAVGYQKNYTVQNDLAAAVPAARKIFAAQPVRVSTAKDLSVSSRRLLARDLGQMAGLYVNQADADAEALRLFDLWHNPRALYRVPLPPSALMQEMGDTVNLTHRRYTLGNGKIGRVIGHAVKAANCEVELTVLA